MRRLLLTAILAAFGSAVGMAQAQVALGLKDAVKDFPRSQLQPQITRPISIELNQTVRSCYETLGAMAGLNVLFNPDVRNDSVSFRVEEVDILDVVSQHLGNIGEELAGANHDTEIGCLVADDIGKLGTGPEERSEF